MRNLRQGQSRWWHQKAKGASERAEEPPADPMPELVAEAVAEPVVEPIAQPVQGRVKIASGGEVLEKGPWKSLAPWFWFFFAGV